MKPGQKTIYWSAGLSQDEVELSPFAEMLVAEVQIAAFFCTLAPDSGENRYHLRLLKLVMVVFMLSRMKPRQRTVYWISCLSQVEVLGASLLKSWLQRCSSLDFLLCCACSLVIQCLNCYA
jgi:hypothetical protein